MMIISISLNTIKTYGQDFFTNGDRANFKLLEINLKQELSTIQRLYI